MTAGKPFAKAGKIRLPLFALAAHLSLTLLEPTHRGRNPPPARLDPCKVDLELALLLTCCVEHGLLLIEFTPRIGELDVESFELCPQLFVCGLSD